ncbi:MAG: universal stress protein [Armatimonas sp.]
MRILLGTDILDVAAMPALRLLQRLRFNAAQIEAVRVVPPPAFPGWEPEGGYAPEMLAEALQVDMCRADKAVKAAAQELGDAAVGPTVLRGSPIAELLHHANETGVDLIAINGQEGNPRLAPLIGSIARGLVLTARQSLLIARPQTGAAERPLRVVLATDHSEYADQCWGQLMRFWPRGISHLTLLTAYPEDRLKAMEPLLPAMGLSPTRAIHDQLLARNEALATRLSNCFHPACTQIDSVLSILPVHEAIAAQLKASEADLLILGAKGHGLLECLTLGSVALREALTASTSVLIVRNG